MLGERTQEELAGSPSSEPHREFTGKVLVPWEGLRNEDECVWALKEGNMGTMSKVKHAKRGPWLCPFHCHVPCLDGTLHDFFRPLPGALSVTLQDFTSGN